MENSWDWNAGDSVEWSPWCEFGELVAATVSAASEGQSPQNADHVLEGLGLADSRPSNDLGRRSRCVSPERRPVSRGAVLRMHNLGSEYRGAVSIKRTWTNEKLYFVNRFRIHSSILFVAMTPPTTGEHAIVPYPLKRPQTSFRWANSGDALSEQFAFLTTILA
ncbi:hypothetical protein NUW58_g6634 [Xylaria curta]|uniref:Uncharacterized protein n=1 Tax=Xylaria curta TaxID=42375 RepID=A0ACC1NRW5_9PEZI|nr:hypothetical protein NUW58_g6634 [Xylaria curta]